MLANRSQLLRPMVMATGIPTGTAKPTRRPQKPSPATKVSCPTSQHEWQPSPCAGFVVSQVNRLTPFGLALFGRKETRVLGALTVLAIDFDCILVDMMAGVRRFSWI